MEQEKITSKEAVRNFFKFHWRGFFAFWIPILALPIMLIDSAPKFRCAWLIVVMAVYWICELLPLYATSILPVVLLPILGVLHTDEVCMVFLKDTLLMFIFSLIVAMAIEYSNLHTRIALGTIILIGIKPRRLHTGLFMVTFFISLWLSNSASTAMMCPVIKGILEELASQGLFNIYMEPKDEEKKEDEPDPSYIALGYYFGVAYAATIGGCGTLIGTGTNMTLKGLYDSRFPNSTEKMDFTPFLCYNLQLAILLGIFTCLYLQIFYLGLFRKNGIAREVKAAAAGEANVKAILKDRYKELGPISCHEVQVIIVFVMMIVILFAKKPGFAPGWDTFFEKGFIKSALPTVFCCMLLFVLPIHYRFFRYCFAKPPYTENSTPSLLSWKYTNDHAPWGLIFLLGGGYALSEGSVKSGMAKWLGEKLQGLGALPPVVIMLILIVFSLMLTNFSSNVAICNIIIPVVCELAVAIKIHPIYLALPSGMATNMAFHLPVGTPPNAIIAGYAKIKSKFMAVAGIGPSVLAVLFLLFTGAVWSRLVYSNIDKFPSWAT